MIVKERAILLSKTKYGEADLILKIITSNGEVFSVMARSALKSKKRFGGGILEPTHYVTLTITRPPDNGSERLPILTEAQMMDDFRGLKTDYDRLTLALHMVKLVGTVAREGDPNKQMFDLLGHALKTVETSTSLALLKTQFDLKLLHQQGVLPPESAFVPFLSRPIKDHRLIDVPSEIMGGLRRHVEMILNQYVG